MEFRPNVLMLSTSDIASGAGIAAYRLHKGLRKVGINSSMIVTRKLSDDKNVFLAMKPPGSKISTLWRNIEYKLENRINWYGLQNIYSVNSKGLKRNHLFKSADIIHFQNMHSRTHFFSLLLFYSARKKPVICTLHDMWALTGHCIYSYDCDRWKEGCGNCPDLSFYINMKFDTTFLMCKIKKYLYSKARTVVVTPSQWLKRIAEESPLFENLEVLCIPYGINQGVFYPVEKDIAKKKLNINRKKKVILFLASSLDITRKGYHYFKEAMLKIKKNIPGTIILYTGRGKIDDDLKREFEIIEMGYVNDLETIRNIYSASDLFVIPSILDNLPNTVLESLACGTPVVGFKSGGIPDMIEHFHNGYLAKKADINDLAKGITDLLSNVDQQKILSRNAVITITENFSEELCVKRYLELYKNCLEKEKT